jgi:glycosyltransferase involved in cell wall biosynthesis
MRILVAHNKYKLRGGEEEVIESERALLSSHGHELFDYIVDNNELSAAQSAWMGVQAVWNQSSFRAVRQRIREVRPQLVHTHNLVPQISPAAYYAAAAEHIPVVHTLHCYKLMCPEDFLFRRGHVCELCVGKTFAWPGVLRGCYRNSRVATAAVAAMYGIHRVAGTWTEKIDIYFAQTEFAKQKYVESGLPAEKIRVKPNFVADPGVGHGDGGYALFVGRLAAEKGVAVLLDAWRSLGAFVPLQICGTGPLCEMVQSANVPGVEYLGAQPLMRVLELMKRASVVIVPSVNYEGTPRTVVEAYACGTPVIASRLGAMKANVKNGVTGLHFEPGNPVDLAAQVKALFQSPQRLPLMRTSARQEYETRFSAERNYLLMMDFYQEAIVRNAERKKYKSGNVEAPVLDATRISNR